MQEKHNWRTGKHVVFELYVHLVFTPKYRRKVFDDAMLRRLETIFREQCALLECELVEFNGKGDHVHLLVSHPTKVSVANLSRVLKGVSARLLRKEFWSQMKTMLWGDHFWSPSYCAVSAGGAPLEVIKKYIEDQNRPTTSMQIKTSKAAHARWKTHELR